MSESRKWLIHRLNAIILAPLFVWLYFSLVLFSTKSYFEAVNFFNNPLFKILIILLFLLGFFHVKLSLSEIFEDYIHNKKIKDVANLLALIFSIIIPLITLILLIYKI